MRNFPATTPPTKTRKDPSLDKLAELLGDIHDLYVLQEKLDTITAAARDDAATTARVHDPMEGSAINRLIASRRAKLQRKALKIGRRVYEDIPGVSAVAGVRGSRNRGPIHPKNQGKKDR